MLELINQSPWAAELFPGWAPDGTEVSVLAVRARYAFDSAGELTPGGPALEPMDRYRDDPNASSLAAAGDGVPFKHGAEYLVDGTVHPLRPGATAREVGVAVTTEAEHRDKRLRVAGRRRWRATAVGLVPSDPEALAPTPLTYEYAFGGVDTRARALETRNPVGMGFSERRRGAKGAELPRIEYRDAPMTRWSQRPKPAGFGPIAPGWQPRRAATDQLDTEALAAGECPYPDPIPVGLYNAAPSDQRLSRPFQGGERFAVHGLGTVGGGSFELRLPALDVRAWVSDGQRAERLHLTADTVVIDADNQTLDWVARSRISDTAGDTRARWVVVQTDEDSRE